MVSCELTPPEQYKQGSKARTGLTKIFPNPLRLFAALRLCAQNPHRSSDVLHKFF
jgi:hypothetical protein